MFVFIVIIVEMNHIVTEWTSVNGMNTNRMFNLLYINPISIWLIYEFLFLDRAFCNKINEIIC